MTQFSQRSSWQRSIAGRLAEVPNIGHLIQLQLRYRLIVSDPWEAFEIIYGHNFFPVGKNSYVLEAEDGRFFLLNPRHQGDRMDDVYEVASLPVQIGLILEPSEALWERMRNGEIKKMIREKQIIHHGIGGLSVVNNEESEDVSP